jgi:hypothetical protein
MLIGFTGCGGEIQAPADISDVKTVRASAIDILSKAKVFIASTSTEIFTVADSGVTVYGGSGRDVITIASGAHSITLDQNIDWVNLSGIPSDFTFKQMGNQLVVYDRQGVIPVVTIPIQGDGDGTQFGFSNGSAYNVNIGAGVMTLGGTSIRSDAPTIISPVSPTSVAEPAPAQLSSAKIYMGHDDFFTVANNGATVYGGNGGSMVLIVVPGTNSVTFDQNISEVRFGNSASNYKFMQTGNLINVYDDIGTLLAKGPVQGGATGTLLTFSNGTGSVKLNTGIMQLGGSTVSAISPVPITSPIFATSTSTTTSTTTTTTTTTSTTTTTLPTSGGSIIFVW